MVQLSRRNVLRSGFALAAGALPLAACSAAPASRSKSNRVYVFGTLHRRHLTSEAYSLAVFEAAIRAAQPDVILTEIPPDRVETAIRTFRTIGTVDEPRTSVFPEYTDVVIPLLKPQGWRVIGCAAWTPDIARNRRAALKAIEQDPARREQWAEHRAASRAFAKAVRGRSDDPRFVHTPDFDRLVAASREPYARHFDDDLGAGGWTQINFAHNALINAALDSLSGQGLRVAITFGTAHKYKILESLSARSDVILENTAALFG